ncbi:ribokinase [Jatrophihabitans cynanchi]|jgi:ribokinase|uniref:Ribokinase n=1 Tax=Jatrophihabitans cynanchi TaxID=2944128 RepID=A0ABY7K7P6_9ACTN|nr:ribokinase [Jatrophihabitans sp. SB3-54]WAX59121.1 ribokinase [Jatrophihabitans sp. SB3-54]
MTTGETEPSVTVVGSLNLDLVVTVGRLPGRGETVVGSAAVTGPGGKGANQAAAAAALSPHVAMVGCVGADEAGARLRADLADRGVDVTSVLTSSSSVTGTATVAVEEPGGENLIVVAPGANFALSAADVDVRAVRSAAVLLAQLEVPLATVRAAVQLAGGIVVLNPAPPQPLPAELLAAVDVLVPNEWELAALAGAPSSPHSPDELAALARSVTSRDVVVTMGGRGALVVPGDGTPVVIAPPAVTPVDTTGAGDCFCGALCVGLADGLDLVAAARYAVTAAALSTTAAGARGLLPDDAAVRSLLAP